MPVAAYASDDAEARKRLVACVNKEIVKENSEWKLPASDLKKFTDIIDREIMEEPRVPKTPEEQRRVLREIEDATRKKIPNLDAETVDEMLQTLQERGQHCVSELGE